MDCMFEGSGVAQRCTLFKQKLPQLNTPTHAEPLVSTNCKEGDIHAVAVHPLETKHECTLRTILCHYRLAKLITIKPKKPVRRILQCYLLREQERNCTHHVTMLTSLVTLLSNNPYTTMHAVEDVLDIYCVSEPGGMGYLWLEELEATLKQVVVVCT